MEISVMYGKVLKIRMITPRELVARVLEDLEAVLGQYGESQGHVG